MAKVFLSLTINSEAADRAISELRSDIAFGVDGGLITGKDVGAIEAMLDHLAPVMFRTVRDVRAERGKVSLRIEATEVCETFLKMVKAFAGKEVTF